MKGVGGGREAKLQRVEERGSSDFNDASEDERRGRRGEMQLAQEKMCFDYFF